MFVSINCIRNIYGIHCRHDDDRTKLNRKLLKKEHYMKSWLLKTLFKSEMNELYNAHREIEYAINNTKLRDNNRKIVNEKLSNWMRIFIDIHE